jgi:caffeoyl-CoA O-methyltransferase
VAIPQRVMEYLRANGVREAPVLSRLRAETAKLPLAMMQIAPEQGALLQMLVRLIAARRCIEVGTFTGYSSLAVALALPDDGRIIACDVSEEWTQVARRYWAEAGVAGKIDLRLAPAIATLDSLIAGGAAGSIDFAFVDADKTGYDAYYERLLTLLRPGGLIVFDNVLWGGSVADPADRSADTEALRALNAKLATDQRIDISMVPVGDGFSLCRKR